MKTNEFIDEGFADANQSVEPENTTATPASNKPTAPVTKPAVKRPSAASFLRNFGNKVTDISARYGSAGRKQNAAVADEQKNIYRLFMQGYNNLVKSGAMSTKVGQDLQEAIGNTPAKYAFNFFNRYLQGLSLPTNDRNEAEVILQKLARQFEASSDFQKPTAVYNMINLLTSVTQQYRGLKDYDIGKTQDNQATAKDTEATPTKPSGRRKLTLPELADKAGSTNAPVDIVNLLVGVIDLAGNANIDSQKLYAEAIKTIIDRQTKAANKKNKNNTPKS